MPDPTLCTEQEITGLVHQFYGRIRADETLGPIFEDSVDDWDAHLVLLVDFWSSLLRGTRRFSGSPMTKHAALPDLTADMFRRWLAIFHQCTAELDNAAMRSEVEAMAGRIANKLWANYQGVHGTRHPGEPAPVQ